MSVAGADPFFGLMSLGQCVCVFDSIIRDVCSTSGGVGGGRVEVAVEVEVEVEVEAEAEAEAGAEAEAEAGEKKDQYRKLREQNEVTERGWARTGVEACVARVQGRLFGGRARGLLVWGGGRAGR